MRAHLHLETDKLFSNAVAAHRKAFTWEALNYTVPVPGGTRRLLHDVYGFVKPGTLTALMGASGAGALIWLFCGCSKQYLLQEKPLVWMFWHKGRTLG